jgi:hypothetical protein
MKIRSGEIDGFDQELLQIFVLWRPTLGSCATVSICFEMIEGSTLVAQRSG